MASNTTYTPNEETEIQQWLTTATRLQQAGSGDDASPILDTLNSHLSTRTTLLGTKPSKADTALYSARTGEKGYPNIVRHLDFVQNYPAFAADVKSEDKVNVDLDDVLYVKPPVDAKAEKERLKKEKAAAAASAAGGDKAALPDRTKDNKKDKSAGEKVKEAVTEAKDKVKAAVAAQEGEEGEGPKPQKAAAPAAPLSPALIDLRVGHILKAIKHPEADSLYVSTIAVGDQPNDDTTEYEGQVCRTVCSGLNGLVPLESMQGRKVVVVCNLKPVKMRGIKSCAMVLAASPKLKEGEVDDHKGPVELVTPPADAKAGERVYFEGWEGEPEGVLNPKKKIWETFQPGFTTTDDLAVAFDAGVVEALGKQGVGKLVTKSGGACTVPSLKDAVVR
ncbi:tRNA-aminoacylation cofactor ARC1 [Colletotrichum liriopes]|uniref:tRNA-aminoacylation cofactor ARC1 n=1 Tax=Colletotrichum liriopes TaxID=708192 RepID=A0AA37GCC3_9PEZI|nr:tRNA-aminoacylation cofactor ARC1 [Colletotrichum liriopes]